MTWVVLPIVLLACTPANKKLHDAEQASRSWAVTVKAVTEQWAQSRVSQRFVRTTLNTAIDILGREAESIRQTAPATAADIDRLTSAVAAVLAAVASNEPGRSRDLAAHLALDSGDPPRPPSAAAASRR